MRGDQRQRALCGPSMLVAVYWISLLRDTGGMLSKSRDDMQKGTSPSVRRIYWGDVLLYTTIYDQEVMRVRSTNPKNGLWKRFLLLIPYVIICAVVCHFYIRTKADTYEAYGLRRYQPAEFDRGVVELTNPDVVKVALVRRNGAGGVSIKLEALKDGKTDLSFKVPEEERGELWSIEVRDGAIIEGGVNFSGWESIQVSTIGLFALLALLFGSAFVHLWRASWYGYSMIGCCGGMLFTLVQFLLFTFLAFNNSVPSFWFFVSDIFYMTEYFGLIGLLLLIPVALAIAISNISLIRHEGARPVNMLGIALGVACLLAFPVWYLLESTISWSYPQQYPYVSVLMGVAVSYGECLLFSTMICALLAAHHVPKKAMDYLIILGCGLRKDGTPCPLLAGRVDRAVEFDRQRIAAGDAPATFVPSGGQGPDEIMSEAQSMANYLSDVRGIDPQRIACEGRSTTTRENMAFSREVIQQHAGRDANELAIGFSTTNYHVFRGYVSAHQAGMAVEGMGAKTKYYFWPNAFLREFAGLLAHRWQALLQVYAIVSAVYLLAAFVYTHV